MGRPWEYPRWRRVVMQVAMWLILGGSLGLAQFISVRSRNAVESIGTQVQVDRFLVRLPDEWPVVRRHDADAEGIQVVDPETHRVLFVLVMKLPSLPGLGGPGISPRRTAGQAIEFTGLQQTGTMRMDTQPEDFQGARLLTRSITAAVSAPPHEAIMIKLMLPPGVQVGRADARLVRDVAAGITALPANNVPDDTDDDGGI